MKLSASLLLSAALAATTAPAAFAYSLSPPDIYSNLRGRLKFDDGIGKPFRCNVYMKVATGNAGTPKGKPARITFAFTKSSEYPCNQTYFNGTPWYLNITGPNSGNFLFDGWYNLDLDAFCDYNSPTSMKFTVNASGDWTFPGGQCLSGTLTSTPAVTIVP